MNAVNQQVAAYSFVGSNNSSHSAEPAYSSSPSPPSSPRTEATIPVADTATTPRDDTTATTASQWTECTTGIDEFIPLFSDNSLQRMAKCIITMNKPERAPGKNQMSRRTTTRKLAVIVL